MTPPPVRAGVGRPSLKEVSSWVGIALSVRVASAFSLARLYSALILSMRCTAMHAILMVLLVGRLAVQPRCVMVAITRIVGYFGRLVASKRGQHQLSWRMISSAIWWAVLMRGSTVGHVKIRRRPVPADQRLDWWCVGRLWLSTVLADVL